MLKPTGLIASVGLLILRVGVGLFMLIAHGWPKLQAFSEKAESFANPLAEVGIDLGPKWSLICTIATEVGCSLLLIVGLGTRVAAAALLFTFSVIVLIVHAEQSILEKELAIIYLIVYASLLATGPGLFSLDTLVTRRRRKKKEQS